MNHAFLRRRRSRGGLAGVIVLAVVAGLATVAVNNAAADQEPDAAPAVAAGQSRIPAAKRAAGVPVAEHESRSLLHLKFVEGSGARLRNGRLVGAAGLDLAAVEKILGAGSVGTVERMFRRDEQALAERSRLAAERSGRQQADLNLWYLVRLKPGVDTVEVLDGLNALPFVETAYPAPLAPPPPAPDFQDDQGYRKPANDGINADYARGVRGGTGANVRVLDIEYSWNQNHEDLSKIRASNNPRVNNGTPYEPFDPEHGTAIVGVLSGDNNQTGTSGGVLGLVPDSRIHLTNVSRTDPNPPFNVWDMAGALDVAIDALWAGDVILIEQVAWGYPECLPYFENGLVPVEFVKAYHDLIVAATSLGIIVVETAGNNARNFDLACFDQWRGWGDSGAIMVGAGEAPGCTEPGRERARLINEGSWESNYGSRVDLQGWGECIVTAGWYGDLTPGADPNGYYSAMFGGTSGAGAIVAGAAASLYSVAKHRGLTPSPGEVRTILRNTATAQQRPDLGLIGGLPNLQQAINTLPAGTSWTASASHTGTGLPASNAIDNNASTRWANGRSQASGQYFQIDFGSTRRFNRLVLDTGPSNTSQYPRRWAVRVSSDGVNWGSPVATGSGNGRYTTITLPTTVPQTSPSTRYIRVTLTLSSTSQWSIAEASFSTW